MALITCPSCGHQISDKALRCPKCGCTPSVRANEDNTANKPSVNDIAVQNPSVQAEGTNNPTSKGIVSPSRPNGEKSAKYASTQDSHIQLRQKGDRISKKTAATLIIVAAVVAVCAAGAIYGIHRHNVKVLAAQQAELQRQMEEEELARQKAIEDSIARVSFQTPDLKMAGAHGPVKRIVYNCYNDNNYTQMSRDPILDMEDILFDEGGCIIKMKRFGTEFPKSKAIIRRNSNKMITEWGFYDSEEELENYGMIGQNFSYNVDDFVCKIDGHGWENGWTTMVTWDETGKLSKTTTQSSGEGMSGTVVVTYSYLKEDKYGNWIEVEVNEDHVFSDDYDGTPYEKGKTKRTITRTIEYYE